jgi:hypothetical protein
MTFGNHQRIARRGAIFKKAKAMRRKCNIKIHKKSQKRSQSSIIEDNTKPTKRRKERNIHKIFTLSSPVRV